MTVLDQTAKQSLNTLTNKPALPASLGRGPSISNDGISHFDSAGFTHRALVRASARSQINYMHFHNSCTPNRDHHILLIMTGNAHKESCYKLSSILVRA